MAVKGATVRKAKTGVVATRLLLDLSEEKELMSKALQKTHFELAGYR